MVLAPGIEDVPGAGLDGDGQAQGVEAACQLTGARREVGGEGVEVHVVEGEGDAVVTEVGQEGQGVGQPKVGQAVGAVGQAKRTRRGHVGLTFRDSRRAAGTRAISAAPVPGAPARAARAAWSGIMARIPLPTARWSR